MKPKPQFRIDPLPADPGVFTLTCLVANVRRCSDGEIVATIHRSWRNAPGASPGVPCCWFCSDHPGQPVEHSETSEADITAKALAWAHLHRRNPETS